MHIRNILKSKIHKYYFDIILFILIILIFNIFFPNTFSSLPKLKKGDVASKDIIAPFTFQLLKNEELLQKEREAAYNNVPPVLFYDEQKTLRIINDFKTMIHYKDSLKKKYKNTIKAKNIFKEKYPEFSREMTNLLFSEKSYFLTNNAFDLMKSILEKGLVKDKTLIPYGKEKKITLIKNNEESIINETDIFDNNEAINTIKSLIIKKYSSNSFLLKSGIELIQHFLRPNVTIDFEQTNTRREKAQQEVPEGSGMVLKGEMIVRAHDIVDQEAEDKLRSLNKVSKQHVSKFSIFIKLLVKNLLFFVIYLLYIIFINTRFDKLKLTKSDKFFLFIIFAFNLIIYGVFYDFMYIEYLLPIILSGAIISLLYSRTFALINLTFIIMTLIIYSGMRLQSMMGPMIGSVYSIYLIRDIYRRSQFFSIMLKISAIVAVFALSIEIYIENTSIHILYSVLLGVLSTILSVIFVLILLPFIEKPLKRITNITLLDLSDLNNSLLKLMAEKASGTFHHSLMVSNLAEHAAKAIGANELLARVGGYYHDIGKIEKPEYYIENQSNLNPHESLPPELSAEIIKEHITKGIELAKSNHLPEQIIDFIRTHHGDSKIDFFYNKAKNKKQEIDIKKFSYSGPIPFTKELSLIMLADSVEAAVRSLKNIDENSIREMVQFVFDKKMSENQLNDSPLSVKEIIEIKEIYTNVLMSIHHPRVDYGLKKEKK